VRVCIFFPRRAIEENTVRIDRSARNSALPSLDIFALHHGGEKVGEFVHDHCERRRWGSVCVCFRSQLIGVCVHVCVFPQLTFRHLSPGSSGDVAIAHSVFDHEHVVAQARRVPGGGGDADVRPVGREELVSQSQS
jgi:hypothetical protein